MTAAFRVLLITDAAACALRARGVIETLARALGDDARAVAVLVREKSAGVAEVARVCAALRPVTVRAGALLLVHTHAALVARLGLDGAHLASGARVDEARLALPPGALLGASRHAGDAWVDEQALDYVTLSPIFRPRSKPDDDRAPVGLERLARAARAARGPRVVALGGVDGVGARACFRAGAAAVAVVGAVLSAHDPRRALLDIRAQAHAARATSGGSATTRP